jgi:hypothetical protein
LGPFFFFLFFSFFSQEEQKEKETKKKTINQPQPGTGASYPDPCHRTLFIWFSRHNSKLTNSKQKQKQKQK